MQKYFNIYNDKDEKEFKKKFKFIHYVLKYKLLVPFIKFISKVSKGYIIREYKTNQWHNKPIQWFDEAFESALYDWTKYIKVRNPKIKIKSYYKNGNGGVGLLRLLKNITLTILSHDNAYVYFLSMLQNRIKNKKYPNKYLIYKDKEVDGDNFTQYYYLGKNLQINKLKINKVNGGVK